MASDSTSSDTDRHRKYMHLALTLARKSPPRPTNFCVGAVLVDSATDTVLATGYTLECEGNTHAEQCCFIKLMDQYKCVEEAELVKHLPDSTVLYTTMEPCNKRSVGNTPCVERVLGLSARVKQVFVGVSEPEIFVGVNVGKQKLQQAGIEVEVVPGFEKETMEVATAGHVNGDS